MSLPPSRKSAQSPCPHPCCPRGGAQLKGGVPAPPAPSPQGCPIWGSGSQRPHSCQAAMLQRGRGGCGGGGRVRISGDPGAEPQRRDAPIPAVSSPNHHSLEVQPPWSLDSNKSFYAGQHIFSQFPMKRPVGFDGAWKVLRPPSTPSPQTGASGALAQWPALPGWRFQASQVQPGVRSWPVFCLRMLVLPLKCFLNL